MTKKTFEVSCVNVDDEGRGIVRIDGQTIFVDNLLKDEKAVVETTYKNGKLFSAKVVKRLSDSPKRVLKPLCKHYFECGGCQLMHLEYREQLKYKKEKVKNLLHKFAKLDFEVEDCVGLDNPWNFRNKVQKPYRFDKKQKRNVTGFYKVGTHQIVPINECLIETKESIIISKEITRLLNDFKYQAYDEDKGTGLVRHVLIKTSEEYNESLVCLVINGNNLPGSSNFVKELTKRCKNVKSVVLNFNTRKTNVILGQKEKVIYGKGAIKERLFNYDFIISAQSFFQTNSYMTETLYKTAFDNLDLNKNLTLLDCYSGTGTIGLSASKFVKEVTLCELNKEAFKDSINNAKINNISNAKFVNDDCTHFILNDDSKYDVVIMDPPRKGSTKEFIDAVCKIKPQKVCYISCNPVTLARDLTYFSKDYKVAKVIPVDMFPHSAHVETVCILKLIK